MRHAYRTLDRVQGIAQFVAQHREELVLRAARLLGLPARVALRRQRRVECLLPLAQLRIGLLERQLHGVDLLDPRGWKRRQRLGVCEGARGGAEARDGALDAAPEVEGEQRREADGQERGRGEQQRRLEQRRLDHRRRDARGHRPAPARRAAARPVVRLALGAFAAVRPLGHRGGFPHYQRRRRLAHPALVVRRARDGDAVLVHERHRGVGIDRILADELEPCVGVDRHQEQPIVDGDQHLRLVAAVARGEQAGDLGLAGLHGAPQHGRVDRGRVGRRVAARRHRDVRPVRIAYRGGGPERVRTQRAAQARRQDFAPDVTGRRIVADRAQHADRLVELVVQRERHGAHALEVAQLDAVALLPPRERGDRDREDHQGQEGPGNEEIEAMADGHQGLTPPGASSSTCRRPPSSRADGTTARTRNAGRECPYARAPTPARATRRARCRHRARPGAAPGARWRRASRRASARCPAP